MAVRARAARTGVYQYGGSEVDPDNLHGLRDQVAVNVLRDDKTVFDESSVRSFLMKPVTDEHPTTPITSKNWKDQARGVIAGAMRDGDHLAFDLLLMDDSAIKAVDAGKRELSNGYDAKLEFGDFTATDGTKCQARQTAIFGNHVALVDRGRAGSSCRIGDAALCDALPSTFLDSLTTQEKPVKTMLIDGLTVDVSNADTAEATIKTLLASRDGFKTKVGDHETTITARDATIVTKDAEITKLTADLAAAKLTPTQMRDAGKAYQLVADKAKAMGVAVTDEMDEGAIKRAVVDKSMGEKAKDYSDEHVATAFDVLTKDAKPGAQTFDAIRHAVSGGVLTPANDSAVRDLAFAQRY